MNNLYRRLAVTNMKNNRQFYVPYLLAGIVSVMMFYSMRAMQGNDAMSSMRGGMNLILILTMGLVVIGIFVSILLFYTNSFIMKRRKKELGIYNILGMEKRHIAKEEAEKTEEKTEIAGLAKIGIDDFAKVEIRVGKVLDCENVKRSNKLLKFTIDDGSKEPRTIVSGIAKWYKPEELKGKNIVFVANLKPVKLCGVESNGMILSAECSEDDVKVLTVDESIPAGSVIG